MEKIIKNAIRCNHCGDVIESTHRYDFVTCSCGCCSVDGGKDYLKRTFADSQDDFTELSVIEDSEKIFDKKNRNGDENMMNTEWIPYMKAYRLYDARYPQKTVAYEENAAVAEQRAIEEGYSGLVICDTNTMHAECQ